MMDVPRFLEELQRSYDYRGQLVRVARVPSRPARYGELNYELHPRLTEALRSQGITRLYSHQASAVNYVLDGAHVSMVTSTASGKTLCYNLPVLHTQLSSLGKCALYLFPTKALAQDQLRKLQEFGLDAGPRFGVYDGDSSESERRSVRRNCHTVLTNPDMLHLSILPHHTNWVEFFRNLAFVVIDEMHVYRGVFGAHVANTIRRLRRICRHYGSVPQFITCSATIGNPDELLRSLTGVRAEIVDADGSPAGDRWFAFWNPPTLDDGARRSSNSEAASLFLRMVQSGVRNITFCRARVVAELICRYALAELKGRPEIARRVMVYRGGYTPEQRREIERGMFDGSLLGVTATTALELGVDIGGLDACILTGYPGTIASTWQQAGRAGRSGSSSLAVLVGLNNPLDQFVMRNPDYVLDGKNERAVLDPCNPYILAEHLLCAAYESPLSELDLPMFGSEVESVLDVLRESGMLAEVERRWYWIGRGYPAADVNLRSTGGKDYTVLEEREDGRILGAIEESSAFQMLHEGSVYLHQTDSYVVRRLDISEHRAYAARCDVEYYTSPRTTTQVEVIEEYESRPIGMGALHSGEVRVTEQVVGFWKRQLMTDTNLAYVDLDLPAQSFSTQAIWFTLDGALPEDVLEREAGLLGGIHAVEHAMIGMMPLYAMCDRQDIGGVSHPEHPQTGTPVIFVYDGHPGGVGICESVYSRMEELILSVHSAISECNCPDGCPSCIQSPKCGSNNNPLDKASSLSILRYLIG